MLSALSDLLRAVGLPVRLADVLATPASWLVSVDDAANSVWEPFLVDDDH